MNVIKKRIVLILAVVFVVLAGGLILIFRPFEKNSGFEAEFFKGASKKAQAKSEDGKVTSALTGELIDQTISSLRPIAVMIENLGDGRNPMNGNARPQAGLDQADIVYEALAEGGITRFMAVYQSRSAGRVMPVRSSRPYYVSWAGDYKSAYFHIGGSPEAASLLSSLRASGGVFDGGASGGWYSRFDEWRRQGRAIEHTAVTDTASMRRVMAARGGEGNRGFDPFLFKSDLTANKRPEGKDSLEINFSSLSQNLYRIKWHYDKENNRYLRYMAGVPHIDQVTGQQLAAKNVIVIRVTNAGTFASGKSRQDIRAIGKGSGYLLRDGAVYPISWNKGDHLAKTVYAMADGTPIVLTRGNTWIEAPVQFSDVVVR